MTTYLPDHWARIQRWRAFKALLRGDFRGAWRAWKWRHGEPYEEDSA